jgi:hypothetical protein
MLSATVCGLPSSNNWGPMSALGGGQPALAQAFFHLFEHDTPSTL